MIVEEELGKENWRFTGFYGELDRRKRHESWELLKRLANQNDKGWLCVRDFNEILWDHEKSRDRMRREMQMVNLRNVLEETGLTDLGYKRSWFT